MYIQITTGFSDLNLLVKASDDDIEIVGQMHDHHDGCSDSFEHFFAPIIADIKSQGETIASASPSLDQIIKATDPNLRGIDITDEHVAEAVIELHKKGMLHMGSEAQAALDSYNAIVRNYDISLLGYSPSEGYEIAKSSGFTNDFFKNTLHASSAIWSAAISGNQIDFKIEEPKTSIKMKP